MVRKDGRLGGRAPPTLIWTVERNDQTTGGITVIGDRRLGGTRPLDQVLRSDGGGECGNRRQEVCSDSYGFPLPFIGGHVASGRFTRDSPLVLSTVSLVCPCHPPPSILLTGWPAQRSEPLILMKEMRARATVDLIAENHLHPAREC